MRAEKHEISAPCGGNGTCKRCSVKVWGRVRSLTGEEKELEGEEILACRYYPAGDLKIELPGAEAKNAPIAVNAPDIPGGGEGLGLAVDIGTTTVAAYVYDLAEGRCVGKASAMNAQRSYGANVISRIQYASDPAGLEELSRVIRNQITELTRSMCDPADIKYISIAANTVMEHIFAGLSPEGIGKAPFKPLSLFGDEYPAADFLSGFHPDCVLYLAPAVSGYVGGDITAGILSSGAYKSEKTVLFIDIGTNGEMALGDKNGFVSCATAAGPAFEGAEIDCGAPAGDGAINAVNADLTCTVLGQTEAETICGSGIIDAVAALLKNGIVDETGRMEEEKYYLTEKVFISARDIRQVQLAKAAIRAGIETLLEEKGCSYEDVDKVLIAGGFGAYMKVESACTIGLLPPEFRGKTVHTGNSAGAGAAMALTEQGRTELAKADALCGYLELSGLELFNDNYIEAMMFEEVDE
ncbi:MAG: DUF4445 domain-containing protein [Oscillospiraceae bacterium]|nr:DUF4445 domain-containing protein [Oscillospiraceae bacterium]